MTKPLIAIPNNTDNRFVSLGELLTTDNNTRKVSVATLVTAIEKFGICSWDKYGRFVKFDHDSPAGVEALQLLEDVYEFENESYKYHAEERHPIDYEEDCENPYLQYGWATKDLPKFDVIRDSQFETVGQKPQFLQREATNNLNIIAALLEYIKGNVKGIKQHPSYKSEALLIEEIEAQYSKQANGLSKRNLEKKFAQAKRIF